MIISITVYVLSLLILTASATVHGPDPIIGIDLGTKYSRVGIFEDGQVKIIPNEHGSKVTPSYVAFNTKGNRLIGDYAKHHLTSNPENTIYDVKRFIGRKWDDPMVQKYVQNYPFNMLEKNNNLYVKVLIGEKRRFFALKEISGMVLGKMKEIAEGYLNRQVTKAIITVPAYFNNAQRQATMDAGTIAGLNVLQIINEPTAAAVAYRILKRDEEKTVLVFDLGGGTFDVSLININHGVLQVLATSGDTQLGGEDFTQRVMNFLIKIHMKNTGVDIRKDKHALQKLHREVERAKRTLSYLNETTIEVEDLGNTEDFSHTLTRTIFEALTIDLFESTVNAIKEVIKNGARTASDVDEIILVGGSTHIPKIQQLVNDYFFGKKPVYYANCDELVAHGAAVQGAVLGGVDQVKNVNVTDVYPFTLWAETPDKKVEEIIHRNSLIPAGKIHIFSTASVHQSNMLMQVYEGKETFSKDVNLLGIFRLHCLKSGPNILQSQIKVTFIIDTNSILTVFVENEETEKSESSTFLDLIKNYFGNNTNEGLSLFDIIKIFFGETKDEETENNKGASLYDIIMESIGRTHFWLGTKFEPTENIWLETKFEPTENMDCSSHGLEEIKQMVKDAKNFTDNDKKVKEIMDARNELENFAYMIKHMISDKGKLGNILSKEDKTVINEEANNIIIWIESKYDLNDLKTKKLRLEQMMRKMIENTLFQGHLYSESKDQEEL